MEALKEEAILLNNKNIYVCAQRKKNAKFLSEHIKKGLFQSTNYLRLYFLKSGTKNRLIFFDIKRT